jgi:cytochrome P450
LSELPYLDLLAPGFDPADPNVLDIVSSGGLARTDVGLAVLRYEWVRALLGDRRLRHGLTDLHALQGVVDGPLADWWSQIVITNEGERHRRLRSLVARAFTPAVSESLRGVSRTTFAGLLDDVAGDDIIDAAGALADQYPIGVLRALLGLPQDRLEEVSTWSNELSYAFSFEVAERRESLESAVVALLALADELIESRRSAPGDDLISRFITAETDDERFTEDELRSMVVAIIFAGHDTTRCQLLRGLELFVAHPDQWERLARDPRLATRAVDEVMRLAPISPAILRVATEDIDIHGERLGDGEVLVLCLGIAHHDPAAFTDANTFDIGADRQPHLSFGRGPHHCVGAALAKVELEEAFLELTARFEAPIVAGEVGQRGPFGIVGPTTLPLRLPVRA